MAEAHGRDGLFRKLLRRKSEIAKVAPFTPLSVLEQLHAGNHPDYCLYLRPAELELLDSNPLTSVESMLVKAFAPLEVLAVQTLAREGPHALPDESFETLSKGARVLWLVPTDDPRFIERLRQLQNSGPLERCIFLMPDQGSFGPIDWPQTWAAARSRAAELGIELSAYTAGGWLFRLGSDGKACTFRPIVNPNPGKIAKALEAICMEM